MPKKDMGGISDEAARKSERLSADVERMTDSVDLSAAVIARPDARGVTVLPADWYCEEDEGLYDDLV